MTIAEAVTKKIKKICNERKITINKLCIICGITQSTLENIVNGNSKNPKLLTITRICKGTGMTLNEFFSDEIFTKVRG